MPVYENNRSKNRIFCQGESTTPDLEKQGIGSHFAAECPAILSHCLSAMGMTWQTYTRDMDLNKLGTCSRFVVECPASLLHCLSVLGHTFDKLAQTARIFINIPSAPVF